MSEACQVGGHEMMNHLGRRIRVTERTIEALEMRGYLHRNRETGLKQISPKNYLVFVEAERTTEWWYELGQDFSGPNVAKCTCGRCQRLASEIDKTPLPGGNPLQDDETSRIVAEVRLKYEGQSGKNKAGQGLADPSGRKSRAGAVVSDFSQA